MIRINLLPPEHQLSEGPPAGRLIVLSLCLVLLGSAFSAFLVYTLVQQPSERERVRGLKIRSAKMEQDLRKLEALEQRRDLLAAQRRAGDRLLAGRRRSRTAALAGLSSFVGARQTWVRSSHLGADGRHELELVVAGADERRALELLEGLEKLPEIGEVDADGLRSIRLPLSASTPLGRRAYKEREHYLLRATMLPAEKRR